MKKDVIILTGISNQPSNQVPTLLFKIWKFSKQPSYSGKTLIWTLRVWLSTIKFTKSSSLASTVNVTFKRLIRLWLNVFSSSVNGTDRNIISTSIKILLSYAREKNEKITLRETRLCHIPAEGGGGGGSVAGSSNSSASLANILSNSSLLITFTVLYPTLSCRGVVWF